MKRFLSLFLIVTFMTTLFPASVFAAFADTDGIAQQQEIAYVTSHNLFQGTGNETFSPEQPFTRAQAVAVLARQAHISGQPCKAFNDVPDGAYYQNALGWAYENQLVQGVLPSKFEPDRPIAHNELITLFERYLAWLGRENDFISPIDTENVSRAQGAVYFSLLDQTLLSRNTSLLTHMASDGIPLTGKLDLPAGDKPVENLVLFVNGSGPNTYDNHRESEGMSFNYYDLFAEQFGARDIGFFRWNTRGVSKGDQPPLFANVDDESYRTYVPSTSVSDIGEWIDALRENERLKDTKIWLLGWSEGTMIAPLAAKEFPDKITGLLLAGYANDRMDEIFDWQQSGESSMIFYRQYFDADGDKNISVEEYTADPYGIISAVLENASFESIDKNQDGVISAVDFALVLAPYKEAFYDAVERGDNEWLANNYGVRLTSEWFQAHRKLAPNRETMLTLDLPIYIFHGTEDANCSVEGVYAIDKSFTEHGKTNLLSRTYEGYDHDLLYTLYVLHGTMPTAFEDLFQTIVER